MSRHDDDVHDPLLGRVIDGRFTLQSVLGRGGMGVVYRAHQASLERSVALKVMSGVPPERENEFQRRFFLEAATVAKLKHPNTITVFDYGSSVLSTSSSSLMMSSSSSSSSPSSSSSSSSAEMDAEPERVFFIAMELLEGLTLSQAMSKGRALPPLRAVHIAVQICRSLREAHKAGVVHRDLKPGNVMLVKQDEGDDVEGDFVKVLDFGLAKTKQFDGAKPIEGITKAGTFMGSPRYVAPEQIEGRPVDPRADIYSFGCILFRMLSGKVPFDGGQAVEIMLKHIHEEPPKLAGLPLSLIKLVDECLKKIPADRPDSMDAVLQRLKLVRAELGGTGSGVMVLSDERSGFSSLPPHPIEVSLSAPPVAVVDSVPEELRTRVDRHKSSSGQAARPIEPRASEPAPLPETTAPSRVSPPPRIVRPTSPGPTETDWGLSTAALASADDSETRPTHAMGLRLQRPPRKPWAPIAAGIVLGLVLCVGGLAYRTGHLQPLIARARAQIDRAIDPPAPVQERAPVESNQPRVTTEPHAKKARVRITTSPPGADVLEEHNGLPRLLGITPLTIDWTVQAMTRELVLRKNGYIPSRATLVPPPPAAREPVLMDVDASLRRE